MCCLSFSLQFYDLIERNQIAMSNLRLRSLTIFAPTNEAFQKYNGSPVQVQYHMCKYKQKDIRFLLMFILISIECARVWIVERQLARRQFTKERATLYYHSKLRARF